MCLDVSRPIASTRVVTSSLFEYIGSFLLPVPTVLFAVPRPLKEYTLQNWVSCPLRFFIPSLLHSLQPVHPSLLLRLFSRSWLPIPGALGSSPVCWQVPGPHFHLGAPFQALAPVSVGSLDIPEKSGPACPEWTCSHPLPCPHSKSFVSRRPLILLSWPHSDVKLTVGLLPLPASLLSAPIANPSPTWWISGSASCPHLWTLTPQPPVPVQRAPAVSFLNFSSGSFSTRTVCVSFSPA